MGSFQDWSGVFPLFHWSFILWGFYLVLAVAFGFMLHVRKRNRQKYSEPCVQCIYVEKCGGCRGVAYGSFGDYFAPDPHCWLDSNGERL